MTLEVACHCGKSLRFPDGCAGRQGICPECGNEVRIPGEGKGGTTLIVPLAPEDEEKAVAPGGFAGVLEEARPAPAPAPAPAPEEPKPAPEKETSAYLPEAYGVVGELVKFHCPCGQKVSAPVNTRRTSGRCPRCRRKLLLPRVTRGKEEAVRPVKEKRTARVPEPPGELGRCVRCGRIISGDEDSICPSCGAPLIGLPRARAGRARIVAGLVDLAVSAAAFSLTAWATGRALGAAWAALLGFVAGVTVWFVNGAGFALASSGRTFGMLAAGLRIEGRPSSRALFKRAALSLAFPMWARDLGGQSFADRKAGTKLAPGGRKVLPARSQSPSKAAEPSSR